MHRLAQWFAACTAVAVVAAAPLDTAAIIGTTNNHSYEIVVRSDGLATLYSGSTALKTFALPADTVARFFSILATARADDWQNVTCPTQTPPVMRARVEWHGWYSADVTCAPYYSGPAPDFTVAWHLGRLNNVVMEVIVLTGPPAAIPCYELPKREQPPGCTH